MRLALYCRVSTADNQNIDTQLLALREYAHHRGFTIQAEYADIGVSGSRSRRPGLDRLMLAARRREIDGVLVARFDRFARSISHLIHALEEFHSLGVQFLSVSEAIDTTTPIGKMIFTVMGAVAELERSLIVERVRAGMRRAKAEGKHCGRPRRIFDHQQASQLHQEGRPLRDIADMLGVSRETIRKGISK